MAKVFFTFKLPKHYAIFTYISQKFTFLTKTAQRFFFLIFLIFFQKMAIFPPVALVPRHVQNCCYYIYIYTPKIQNNKKK